MADKAERKWDTGFHIDFDIVTGISWSTQPISRHLSDMKGFYADAGAYALLAAGGDPLIYEYYDLDAPAREGDLSFGTTILFPGKVGEEFYMTKGHFHRKIDTSEVYYCLKGEGCVVMEHSDGDARELFIRAGETAYVPRGYAHRSVNTGSEPLVLFFVYAADSGHDYGTIETKGFRHIVCERNGKVIVEDNPGNQAERGSI